MTHLQTAPLVGIAAVVTVLGLLAAWWIGRRLDWPAAGPMALIAATPFIPNYSIALGFSLDDVLPLLGTILLVRLLPWRRPRAALRPRAWAGWTPSPSVAIALAGLLIIVVAGLISAIVNAASVGDVIRLALRGSGRMLFLLAIVVSLAVHGSTPRSRLFGARAIAVVGTLESIFGLVAYEIGLPLRAGLESTRDSSVLNGHIPGRIAGTLGISPNFTGAVLLLSIMVTAGLASQATGRRERLLAWAAMVVQLAALALTFSRVSLGLTVIALGVLVIMRSRPLLLLPIAAVLALVAVGTPMLSRFVRDVPDRLALWSSAFRLMVDHPIGGVGPGQMLVAVAANPARYRQTDFGQALSTAHNTILLAGAEMGVLAALGAIVLNVGLLLVAAQIFLRARRAPDGGIRLGASLGLAGFVAQGMVNNLLTVGVTGVAAAFVIGALLVDSPTRPPKVLVCDDARYALSRDSSPVTHPRGSP